MITIYDYNNFFERDSAYTGGTTSDASVEPILPIESSRVDSTSALPSSEESVSLPLPPHTITPSGGQILEAQS